MSANDKQVGGDHYAAAIQHWDLVVKWCVPYLEAQAMRYVTRCHKKNKRQDLEKALHFAEKLADVQSTHWLVNVITLRGWTYPRSLASARYTEAYSDCREYTTANNLDPRQELIVWMCLTGCDARKLVQYVRHYMHDAYPEEGDVRERILWHFPSGFNGTTAQDIEATRHYVNQGD